jgi:hypothetical protein
MSFSSGDSGQVCSASFGTVTANVSKVRHAGNSCALATAAPFHRSQAGSHKYATGTGRARPDALNGIPAERAADLPTRPKWRTQRDTPPFPLKASPDPIRRRLRPPSRQGARACKPSPVKLSEPFPDRASRQQPYQAFEVRNGLRGMHLR